MYETMEELIDAYLSGEIDDNEFLELAEEVSEA